MKLTSLVKLLAVGTVISLAWWSAGVTGFAARAGLGDIAIEDIAVEVTYTGGNSRTLAISLTNNGSEVAEVWEFALPWRHRHSIELLLLKSDDAMSVIEAAVPPIEDPVAAIVKIAPGEVINGEIHLSRVYPTLEAELTNSRVDLFYAFDLRTVYEPTRRRFGGWFNIPKIGKELGKEGKEGGPKRGHSTFSPGW